MKTLRLWLSLWLMTALLLAGLCACGNSSTSNGGGAEVAGRIGPAVVRTAWK